MLNAGRQILSQLVFATKYANAKPDGTKETQPEAVKRVFDMHESKIFSLNRSQEDTLFLLEMLHDAEQALLDKIISPSMRTFQFAGEGIARSEVRGYNCSYLPLCDSRAFGELMFLLMSGCGVGFSCEREAIVGLPPVYPGSPVTFQVADTKEAWADSMVALLENPDTVMDYSKVRPEGSPLSTGGTASGPGPLRKAHNKIKEVLRARLHQRLRPIDVLDIACHGAAAVHCGGVRRSAMIAIFDKDDAEMLACKSGDWYVANPQRSQANISARFLPGEDAGELLRTMMQNGSGEPGVFRAQDKTSGTNPCCEVTLRPFQFCNLTSVNLPACGLSLRTVPLYKGPDDLVLDLSKASEAVALAAFLGTLQASYTDFHYLRPEWRRSTEEEALIGVSLNGLADIDISAEFLRALAATVNDVNRRTAAALGINPAARTTVVKPEGTNSLYLGCSPGIHSGGAYGTHYWRRMTLGKSEPITAVLQEAFRHAPWEAVEQNGYGGQEDKVFLKVPVIAHASKPETAVQFLERVSTVYENWIKPGSAGSDLVNNVSATCTYKEDEKEAVLEWMAKNADRVGSLSFLPADTHTYAQPIYETRDADATAAADLWLEANLPAITKAIENAHLGATDIQAEPACAGGVCEVR